MGWYRNVSVEKVISIESQIDFFLVVCLHSTFISILSQLVSFFKPPFTKVGKNLGKTGVAQAIG